MLKHSFRVAAMLCLLLPCAKASAHNGTRIYLTVENGQLEAGLDTFINGHAITPDTHIFRAEFGNDAGNPLPNFTQFPGLSGSATGVTALPPGTTVSFNFLDAVKYWDGTDDVEFVVSPQTISISSGLNVATSGPGFIPGFNLVAAVPSTDGWHTHPGYTLNNDGLGQSYDGIYLLKLSLSNNNLTTNPIWLVFSQNVDVSTMNRAVEHLQATAVPEPASLGLLATAGVLSLLLRRREK